MKDNALKLNTSAPSSAYVRFFAKFDEINTLPEKQWEVVHILSYFCKYYEQYYGVKYAFKFNNSAPSKSFEVFQIKKLAMLLSSDPVILKNYIDWVFEEKVHQRKRRITSIGYLSTIDMLNEFKFKKMFNGGNNIEVINRSTQIPEAYLEIISEFNPDIKTYGDLCFLRMMPSEELKPLWENLQQAGMNLSSLDHIK